MYEKKEQAAFAAMGLIQDGMVIGLGGGRTIALLVQLIADSGKDVKVVTPSWETKQLCGQLGVPVLPTEMVKQLTVAFDGCNEVDYNFYALKSGGGIHTQEKLIAAMAEVFIILADDEKYVDRLRLADPVTLEVLPEAALFVQKQVNAIGANVNARKSSNKDGFTRTDNGNLLLDCYFPNDVDPRELHKYLKSLVGVVETALFIDLVDIILVADENGVHRYVREESRD